MQCTTIYTSENICEHNFGIRRTMASYHPQFVAIRRVVLILCDSSSKQRALIPRNGGISYRGVHFNVDRDIVGGCGCLFCHGEIIILR